MKIVVYLDILLVTNFIAGYFLLRAAGWLAGAACTAPRALAGAALAAASTLILLAPALPAPLGFAYKLASAALVTLAAFGWHGLRPFLRAGAWFFALNLGLAGLALLGLQRGGMNGVRVHNLTVYADLSPMVLVLSVLAVYLAVRLVLLVFGPPADQEPWQLELRLAGSEIRVQAYYDTGFFLRDPVGGRQTLLVSWPGAERQLSDEVNAFLRGYFSGQNPLPPEGLGLRLVPCSGAAGSAVLPGLTAAGARLTGQGRTLTARNVTAVFTAEPLRDGQFQALFGREFLMDETERRSKACT